MAKSVLDGSHSILPELKPLEPTACPGVKLVFIVQSLSRVQLTATPWTAALQAPLSNWGRHLILNGMGCGRFWGLLPRKTLKWLNSS